MFARVRWGQLGSAGVSLGQLGPAGFSLGQLGQSGSAGVSWVQPGQLRSVSVPMPGGFNQVPPVQERHNQEKASPTISV